MKVVSVFIAFTLPLMAKSSDHHLDISELAPHLAREIQHQTEQSNDYDYDVLAERPAGYRPSIGRCPFGYGSIGDGGARIDIGAATATEEKKEKKKSKKEKKEKKEKKKRRHSKKMESSSSSSSSSSDSEASEKRARNSMKKELKKKGTLDHPAIEGADINQCPYYQRFLAERSGRK